MYQLASRCPSDGILVFAGCWSYSPFVCGTGRPRGQPAQDAARLNILNVVTSGEAAEDEVAEEETSGGESPVLEVDARATRALNEVVVWTVPNSV